jgi:hypothetical protein
LTREVAVYLSVPHEVAEPAPIAAPYPNIRTRHPPLYNAALTAEAAYRKVEYFRPFYDRLRKAAEMASLALDDRDLVTVNPERTSLLQLLPAAVARKVSTLGVRRGLGERAGQILGVLDLLLKLKYIYDTIEAKKLVNEQRHSRRDEAFRVKLLYFITLMVPEAMQKSPFREPIGARNWLENMYWEYDKLFRAWASFNALEKDLARATIRRPGYREPPRIDPYPR